MASDWAEEKLGLCEMKGCEDPELRQPLLWMKTNSGGKYRCEKCRVIAANAKEWTHWVNTGQSQASTQPRTMRIYVKTLSGKTIATDVGENDVIDLADFQSMDHDSRRSRSRGKNVYRSRSRSKNVYLSRNRYHR